MSILIENLRFALTVPHSTIRLRCSIFNQTELFYKNLRNMTKAQHMGYLQIA